MVTEGFSQARQVDGRFTPRGLPVEAAAFADEVVKERRLADATPPVHESERVALYGGVQEIRERLAGTCWIHSATLPLQ